MEVPVASELRKLLFYFDFLSPFSYLARHELERISMRSGANIDIEYRAIDLMQAKKAIGNTGPGNRDLPIKLNHIKTDLQRWAGHYGIPLKFPPNFNSALLNKGLYFPACQGREAAYVKHAFDLVWGLGEAPDGPDTLAKTAAHMGWDLHEFRFFVHETWADAKYETSTQEAIHRQVFGVPTMVVGEEMWWGNDRLFFLEQFLTGDKK